VRDVTSREKQSRRKALHLIFGESEVENLHGSFWRDLDVGGFQVAWMTLRSCAYSSAAMICLAIASASSTGIGPVAIRSASVGPSTNARVRQRTPSDCTIPKMGAMFG